MADQIAELSKLVPKAEPEVRPAKGRVVLTPPQVQASRDRLQASIFNEQLDKLKEEGKIDRTSEQVLRSALSPIPSKK